MGISPENLSNDAKFSKFRGRMREIRLPDVGLLGSEVPNSDFCKGKVDFSPY